MATNLELDSGIVVTRFFSKGAHRIQLNLREGVYQVLSSTEAKELRNALTELLAEATKPRLGSCPRCGAYFCVSCVGDGQA